MLQGVRLNFMYNPTGGETIVQELPCQAGGLEAFHMSRGETRRKQHEDEVTF
jgi:hypothetical protein